MTRPTAGVRYVVDRVEAEAGVVYRGFAHLPSADVPLEVRIAADGSTTASLEASEELSAESKREMEKEAAALVRSATKGALTSGALPPRRIARWRG